MFPLKDNNPTNRTPIITILIILLNVIVFILTGFGAPANENIYNRFAVIPANVISLGEATGNGASEALFSLITSQFLHGGLLHLVGNMLFLWIFGNNVEDKFGKVFFLLFYLFCGVAAAFSQIIFDAHSMIPMIGASGAVAGVMGAYLLLFPKAQVLTLIWVFIFIRMLWLPAYVIIILWVAIQIINQVFFVPQGGGVAYMAHIGGFMAGIALFFIYRAFASIRGRAY